MAGDANAEIPESGAVFTFGRSRFANNAASHFFIRNDPVVEMGCGDEHTAVVCQNGRVFAFGSNSWGQLGLGHKNTATMPSCVKSLKPEKATHVACGKSHTIVSTSSGKVFAFGSNMDCQLGLGDTEERSSPVEVVGISVEEDGVRMLAAGCQHSAVLTVDGGVHVWGSNADGQLGLGESVSTVDTPRRLDIPHVITHISCGYYHTALVTEEGKLLMCGEGENGKLGLSRENRNVFIPTPVNINVPIRSVSCGGNHTIAVSMDGDVYGFGSNLSGQLGLGREVLSFSVPECVETLLGKHICAAACGEIHTAFLTVEGHMYVSGDGRHGKLCIELESGDDRSVQCTPQFVSRFSQYRVKQVACGGCHTMVQAILETDASRGESDGVVNGDMSLRLQKVEANQEEKPPATMEGLGRVLPPLQNAPVVNGHTEKPLKQMNDINSEIPSKETTGRIEILPPTDIPHAVLNSDSHKTDLIDESSSQNEEEKLKVTKPSDSESSEDDIQSQAASEDHSKIVNGNHQGHNENGLIESESQEDKSKNENDMFSKYNLQDAGDLTADFTNEIHNGEWEKTDKPDESDTPRTAKAEDGQESEEKNNEDRRCSTDVTPTLTVTGTDGVDLDAEDANVISADTRSGNKQNTMSSTEKAEGRVTKFLNAFRRKKLSEENVSVNAAWADVERRISSENNLKNGKRSAQAQIRAMSEVHKSKACIIL